LGVRATERVEAGPVERAVGTAFRQLDGVVGELLPACRRLLRIEPGLDEVVLAIEE